MTDQPDKTDEQVIAEFMGWVWNVGWGAFYVKYAKDGPFTVSDPMREVERKLAEDELMVTFYPVLLAEECGMTPNNFTVLKALMTATDAQRVKAAASAIRGRFE